MGIKVESKCKHIGYVLSRISVCHKMAHNTNINAIQFFEYEYGLLMTKT